MNIISNSTPQVTSVRTVTSLNYIRKTYNVPQNEIKSFDKLISEDTKSTIVSDQQDNYPNPASFNYQYQQNVPVSLLSTASQPYNETSKPLAPNKSENSNDETENSDYYVEDSNEKGQMAGLNYYIIDNSVNSASGDKTTQKLYNPMKDRINKIYNLNFGIDPGTIVNVTCI